MEKALNLVSNHCLLQTHVYPVILDFAGQKLEADELRRIIDLAFLGLMTNLEWSRLGEALRLKRRFSHPIATAIVERWTR